MRTSQTLKYVLLWYLRKHSVQFLVRFSQTIESISLTLRADTETFHLEQSFVTRPKQTRRATELLVHLRVKTHERTLKHTSLWLGRKTQRFSGTNQMPERLRPFGTSLVRQCPQGLFRPNLKSTHSPGWANARNVTFFTLYGGQFTF